MVGKTAAAAAAAAGRLAAIINYTSAKERRTAAARLLMAQLHAHTHACAYMQDSRQDRTLVLCLCLASHCAAERRFLQQRLCPDDAMMRL